VFIAYEAADIFECKPKLNAHYVNSTLQRPTNCHQADYTKMQMTI